MYLLELINSMISNIATDNGLLGRSLSSFAPGLYSFADSTMSIICMPVGYSILALFFLLEMQKISTKVESVGGTSQMGAELVFKLLFKLVLCKLVVDMSSLLLNCLFDVSTYISSQIGTLSGSTTITGMDLASVETTLADYTFWQNLIIMLLCFLTFLVELVAILAAEIIIVCRFFQIYILFAVAPVPLSTLPHEEWSQIGKGYIKTFAAACVQGIVLTIILAMFPVLMSGAFLDSGTTGELLSQLFSIVGYSVVLVISIIGSSNVAKRIMNAM